ncbi:MAG: endonuclease domain-containing protein, partial [Prosthecobacter sp.]|nr:endonuclease domain-containing protein [Prosthecobacter sp.]
EPYVLDFYCAELSLAIELDGSQHNSAEGRERDERRAAYLRSKGIETLRFTNQAMLADTDSVLSVIWDRTRRKTAPLTRPLPASSDAS